MTEGGYRMKRGRGLIAAMTVALVSACASAGGGGATGEPSETGYEPRDDSNTNTASIHLVQASQAEGEEARAHYEQALTNAITAIQADSTNPKAYMIAGQAAVGAHNWVQADTMFDRALEMYPQYEDRIAAEREQGWITAYNTGAEALTAGEMDRAIALFEGADLLYQERPEARMALGSLYTRRGETEKAAEAYRAALEILSGPPPEGMDEEQAAGWEADRQVVALNAAQLLAQSGDFQEAAAVLENLLSDQGAQLDAATELRARTALAGFLAQAGETERAEAMFDEIYAREDLTSSQYFQVGIGFFNTGDYARAAEAFTEAAERNPYNRDALLNLVQSLYSQALEIEELEETDERNHELREIYDELLAAAEEVRAYDPLNRNLLSFMLRSLRAKADLSEQTEADDLTRRTQELYRAYQQQSYEVTDIAVALQGENQLVITGALANLTGNPGEEVQLQFTIVDSEGNPIDRGTVTVPAPEQNAAQQFNLTLEAPGGEFAGWLYEVLG